MPQSWREPKFRSAPVPGRSKVQRHERARFHGRPRLFYVAAPGDGRTPPTPDPAVTEGLHAVLEDRGSFSYLPGVRLQVRKWVWLALLALCSCAAPNAGKSSLHRFEFEKAEMGM